MLRLRDTLPTGLPPLTMAQILEALTEPPLPFRFSGFDGSRAGLPDAPVAIHLTSRRGAAYLATAPGSLGMARAYVMGDLEVAGVHPGDPTEALVAVGRGLRWRRPDPATLLRIVRSLGPPACSRRHRRRRRHCPTGAGRCAGCGTAVPGTRTPSTITTTSRTGSTSCCSDRR